VAQLERRLVIARSLVRDLLPTTSMRRIAVDRLRERGYSERAICDALGFSRSSIRHRPKQC